MALYPNARHRLIPPGPNDPKIKPRVLILHVDAGNAASLYHWFNGPSGGIESHFHIPKVGQVEQYRDTDYEADANTDANPFAISAETQGYEFGVWNDHQLAEIKALILWANRVHGIPLKVVDRWDGSGIGYHTQFPGRWDKRGASCPGPDRKRQFREVIVPWLAEVAKGAQATKPKPTPAKKPTAKPTAPAFPLPRGHWYGVESRDRRNHSGYYAKDRPGIKQWQAQMKKRGWKIKVDGRFGPQSRSVALGIQRQVGITADGLVGIRTWTESFTAPIT